MGGGGGQLVFLHSSVTVKHGCSLGQAAVEEKPRWKAGDTAADDQLRHNGREGGQTRFH